MGSDDDIEDHFGRDGFLIFGDRGVVVVVVVVVHAVDKARRVDCNILRGEGNMDSVVVDGAVSPANCLHTRKMIPSTVDRKWEVMMVNGNVVPIVEDEEGQVAWRKRGDKPLTEGRGTLVSDVKQMNGTKKSTWNELILPLETVYLDPRPPKLRVMVIVAEMVYELELTND